jgi:general secretion pathway protein C
MKQRVCSWLFHHNRLMKTTSFATMTPRLVAFVAWSLAAGTLSYWGLRMWPTGDGLRTTGAPTVAMSPAVDAAAVARLLGSLPAAAPAAAAADATPGRFVLQGVVSSNGPLGVALIAVDGKPARPVRVGGAVAEGWLLQSVARRRAVLVPSTGGTETLALEMPVRATGPGKASHDGTMP